MLCPLADGALDVGKDEAGRGGGEGSAPGAEGCGLTVGGEEAAAWAYVVQPCEGGEGGSGHIRMAGEERA